jgi:hypothetical protein
MEYTKYRTNLGHNVNCLMVLSSFKKVCSFSADFCRCLQCHISRKSFQWEPPDTSGQTDSQKVLFVINANAPKYCVHVNCTCFVTVKNCNKFKRKFRVPHSEIYKYVCFIMIFLGLIWLKQF